MHLQQWESAAYRDSNKFVLGWIIADFIPLLAMPLLFLKIFQQQVDWSGCRGNNRFLQNCVAGKTFLTTFRLDLGGCGVKAFLWHPFYWQYHCYSSQHLIGIWEGVVIVKHFSDIPFLAIPHNLTTFDWDFGIWDGVVIINFSDIPVLAIPHLIGIWEGVVIIKHFSDIPLLSADLLTWNKRNIKAV